MNTAFLRSALNRHPESEPVDAVKFLYQHVFGCGHLLPDLGTCIARLQDELRQTEPREDEPAFEPLGNDLCRLNLHHPLVRTLSPERIAKMMYITADHVQGTQPQFHELLSTLRLLAAQDDQMDSSLQRLPFSVQALDAYLQTGLKNLPPSHSDRYRQAYQPTYRVVLARYGEALPLLAAVETHLQTNGKATLVIDGYCASGKTTLTALLAPLYDCNVFHMDDFFLPLSLRTPQRFALPGGNIHHERFLAQVLQGLQSATPFIYDAFDFHKDISTAIQVPVKPVQIIEGSYALHPAFEEAYTALQAVRVLLTVDPSEQMARILTRNGPVMAKRFEAEWIPLEFAYFQAYHRGRGDVIALHSKRLAADAPPKEEAPL